MAWTDDYIDLPYQVDGRSRGGVDCWGLVHLIYRERLGIVLPDKAGIHTAHEKDLAAIAQAMDEEASLWKKVEKPDVYDVVLMRRGILACHVGICVGEGRFLHVVEGTDSTLEDLGGLRWGKRVVGFYRYERP